ncbi:hypothetical protein TNIN_492761 [Trichonephila inaurata madagascariensis]|uniref:Uncharacterized protein n=1 Tax=Trichonephila inaurata madagascariensis TaxID=2747483 RepID=A0A8X7CHT2_9ARAC|nr:hypothetical protein TNIN_437631 [Trichonephila inaurata madagascariensis]GFY73189.1 hypothetical protein TNIN_492761 [Trichonephila inaurata madagascariensis]
MSVQGKNTGLKENQGDRRKSEERKRNVGSKESSLQIKLKRQQSPDHPEERCMTKGNQSDSKEEGSRSLGNTTRIQATGRSLDARVVKNWSRSRVADDQAVRVHDEPVEDTDSKNARR